MRSKIVRNTWRFVGVAVAAWAVSVTAQDQPTLDELLDLAPPPPPEQGVAPPAEGGEASDTPDEATAATDAVTRRLEDRVVADAFVRAVDDMGVVADRIDVADDPGLDTQRMQESILARLDQMIEAAERQEASSSSSSSSSGSSGSSSNQDSAAENAGQTPIPGSPQPGQGQQAGEASRSAGENAGEFSPGQVGAVEPGQGVLNETRREWGNLPPRLREALTDGLDEPYSPVYRDETEGYYRALAEEAE